MKTYAALPFGLRGPRGPEDRHGDQPRRHRRRELVTEAAREVWAFFVQRELCGLRDQKQVIAFYGIPNEVLVRLGASDKPHR